MVTANWHDELFPLLSVAVAVTRVVPKGKLVPDGGLKVTMGIPQLSVAEAA